MNFTLPDSVLENSFTLTILTIFSLIAVAIKVSVSLNNFYEEYVLQRRYKRINALLEKSNDGELKNFLVELKESEVFRISTGISASPTKARALMKYYSNGDVSWRMLKKVAKFLIVDDDNLLELSLTKNQTFILWYSLLSGIFIFIYGLYIFWGLSHTKNILIGFVVAPMFLLFVSYITRLMISDFKIYRHAKTLNFKKFGK